MCKTMLKEAQKAQEQLKTTCSDLRELLTDALNVKLRYEEIIKKLLDLDTSHMNHRSVRQIIVRTKPTRKVNITVEQLTESKGKTGTEAKERPTIQYSKKFSLKCTQSHSFDLKLDKGGDDQFEECKSVSQTRRNVGNR